MFSKCKLLSSAFVVSVATSPSVSSSSPDSDKLGVVEYQDMDTIIKRFDMSGNVFCSIFHLLLCQEQVAEMFTNSFYEGLGPLEGEFLIQLNDSAKPAIHEAHFSSRPGCSSH